MTQLEKKGESGSLVEEMYAIPAYNPLSLAWRATWLDQRAYYAVHVDHRPLRRGFVALFVALLIAAVSRLIGIGLGILTSPRISVIQDQLYDAIAGNAYFSNLLAETPDLAAQFDTGYAAVWDLIRLFGGYPSYSGLGSSLINLLLVLANWFIFTALSYAVARWFGTGISFGRALGIFALAYTPVMLTAIEMIPGARVAWLLIFMLILVAKFLAAREAYDLGAGASLAVITLPYLIGLLLIAALLIFGAAFGLSQIPYLDELLRSLSLAGLLGG